MMEWGSRGSRGLGFREPVLGRKLCMPWGRTGKGAPVPGKYKSAGHDHFSQGVPACRA